MSAPVRHPDDPSRFGVLIPWEVSGCGEPGCVRCEASHHELGTRTLFGRWDVLELRPRVRAYLLAHEFDPAISGGLECIAMEAGFAVFRASLTLPRTERFA